MKTSLLSTGNAHVQKTARTVRNQMRPPVNGQSPQILARPRIQRDFRPLPLKISCLLYRTEKIKRSEWYSTWVIWKSAQLSRVWRLTWRNVRKILEFDAQRFSMARCFRLRLTLAPTVLELRSMRSLLRLWQTDPFGLVHFMYDLGNSTGSNKEVGLTTFRAPRVSINNLRLPHQTPNPLANEFLLDVSLWNPSLINQAPSPVLWRLCAHRQ